MNYTGIRTYRAEREDKMLNLQPMLDADDGLGIPTPQETEQKVEEKKKTFDEILAENKEYQSEFDRRITKGIQTALENEKERIKKIADEKISEAEKLAKMNEEEKARYEQDKREKEIARREAELAIRELKATAKNSLAEKKLPCQLADLLDYSSAEKCKESIEALTTAFNEAVKGGVEDRMKGGKPPKEATNNDDSITELEKEIAKSLKSRF